jgi:hypothetical protein
MIIFNTIKKAEHYVKFCNNNYDYRKGGYDWSSRITFIENNLIKVNESGDGCGCGCDNYRYSTITIIGRIKAYDTKSIRDSKLKNIGL